MHTSQTSDPSERRQYLAVRDVFDQAFELCLPFLDPARGIAGRPLTHHVPVVLREHFPHLQPQDLMVLVSALQAAFRVRGGARLAPR